MQLKIDLAMNSRFIFLSCLVLSHLYCINCDVNVAVVEYQPIISPNDTLSLNVDNYVSIMEETKTQNKNLDLIIFPEATLNTGITDFVNFATLVRIGESPCDDKKNATYPDYIQRLSCSARKIQTYLLINTIEKDPCNNLDEDNCEKYGYLLYNTDIVFDIDGSILQRYRKRNLFGEFPLNTPDITDNATITIKSVEFGIFTCFDMMFKHPAEDLVDSGIKNFIFPSMWFSELPFLTALQTQQMWAMSHGVNLYAAGANNPLRGSGGSSIINGESGPIIMDIISGDGGTNVYTEDSLVMDDEIDSLSRSMDSFYLLTDDNMTDYTSIPLDDYDWSAPLHQTICNTDGMCCMFHIEASIDDAKTNEEQNSYTYHLVMYSGIRSFGGVHNGGIEICGIIACLDSTISSCGLRFPNYDLINWDKTFKTISISLDAPASAYKTHYPNSLLSSIRPLSPSKTIWSVNGNESFTRVNFELVEPQNRLLTFAIYGRNFEIDYSPYNSGRSLRAHDFAVLSTVMIIVYLAKWF